MADVPLAKETTEFDKRATVTELFELKKQIKVIEEREIKALKLRVKELEGRLFANIEVGEQIAFEGIGSVSIKEEIQPNVEDWEKFYAYITKTQNWFYMKRSVNAAPFRDAINVGDEIPGVVPVNVKKLSATVRK